MPAAQQEAIEEYKFVRDQDWQQTRDLALEDLWTFITLVLWPDISDKHYQESLHEPVATWCTSATPGCRKLLLMPRKHRKTYVATIAQVVWRILRDPDIRILVVSGLDATAKSFLGVIKRQFQYNKTLRYYFPEFAVDPKKQLGDSHEFTHPKREDYNLVDPTVCATYLGAPLAGRRCDILIFDDPIEKKHVTTPEQADKALHWFNDLIPVVDENPEYNIIFVIGTRWSFNDIYGALLGEDRGDDQNVELEVDDVYESIVRHCLEDADNNPDFDHGTPIFHKLFTRGSLLKMLAQYRKDPKQGEEDWWKQMMNVCQSPKGQKFLPEWFDTWVPQLPSNIVWSGIVIDSATKDEQVIMRGDHTAVILGHFDVHGHLYLSEGLRSDSMKSPDLMNETLSIAQSKGVYNIVKEKVGEEMFFGMVKNHFHQARCPITTYPLSLRGKGRKVVRIVEAVQAPAMGRMIHFVEGFPKHLHKVLKDELVHIGQWSHDDMADALSCFFHKDIRVNPELYGAVDWKVRNTRQSQQSTKDTVPAALTNWRTRRTDVEDEMVTFDPSSGQIPADDYVAGSSFRTQPGRVSNVNPTWTIKR